MSKKIKAAKFQSAIRPTAGDRVFSVCNYAFLILLNIIMLYPIIYTFSISISDQLAVQRQEIWLYPVGFTLQAYKEIIADGGLLRAYANTILYSVVATGISVTLLCLTAYPLSVPGLKWKGQITFYFAVTMFFGGGMIPSYLLIRSLGMLNTMWAVVLPGALSTWYIVLCRTFFQGIPGALRESAQLDGASEWVILFRIIIPLSKALLAVMALYVVVGQWNSYFGPFIYLSDEKKFPLQVALRKLLTTAKLTNQEGQTMNYESIANQTTPQTLRCAAIMVTIAPIMCVYPFVQKYFVKGVMIGSIKG